ncbi:hypothetical protein LLEC1_07026 [Akanthomyces lecanii]|uniref:Nucleolar complex protein 2 n=1 Tax=Cordyceps confragosa TaxID=2714763 RepID=A0A179IHM4_CORDF|nr:hypothetical protein LLEC1_07026 [Akanthomyces lecanii]
MGPSKKNLKATKKFESKHLQGVLDRRKVTAKIKQKQQIKDKLKQRKAKDAEFYGKDGKPRARGRPKDRQVNDMSVDDFFKGGFEDIIDDNKDAKAKLGKRKRDEVKEDIEEDAGESDAVEAQPVASDSEDGADFDDADFDDAGMNQDTMDALAEKDPEFYKFLKENDPDALDFDDNADLAEVDGLSAGELSEQEDEQPKKKQKKPKNATAEEDEAEGESKELTTAIVAGWRTSMKENKSLRATRQVVLAFRCAAHLNEDDIDEDSQQKWTISSPEVFNDVLVLALREIPVVINHHLPVKESASGRVYVQTDSKKFSTLSLLLKTYTSALMHLLGTLSDDRTLKLTLSAITPILPYLLSFKKLIKALAKAVVNFWAQPASSETTRITAFLVLRRLVTIGDKGIREVVLKSVYQGLVQGCRITNHNTIQGINLMKNSAAELWGIDPSVGYTTAFSFIRQLAIHLRNSIVHNKNDSFRMVYNWQFTHSLDFWSCVLAYHCTPEKEAEAGKESQLKLLVYPLVQVTLGAMRLIPTALYFPLRFHLVLASAEMKKPPKNTTLKAFDFAVAYKASKAYLRTRVYQDGVGEQVVELLGEFMHLWSRSIAFPELALPVVIQLKRWLKQSRSRAQGNKNGKLGAQLVLLVQKLEANAKFVEAQRAKVDFAPSNRTQVDNFLRELDAAKTPLGAYIIGQRKSRAEKAKLLDEARKGDDRKRREDEKAALEDDVDMMDSDEDMEVDDEEDEFDLDDEEEDEEDEEEGEEDEDDE